MKKVGTYGGSSSNLTGFGGGFQKKKRFYIEEGSNLYRILPPFGSCAETGAIAKYHAVYWFKNSAGKKMPVPSVLKITKDKKIVNPDVIYDAIEQKKRELKEITDTGADPALIEAFAQEINSYNLDKAYYVNAMNVAGEIGVLKIKVTAWDSLKQRLAELEKAQIDPINVGPGNGIIFDFKRYKDEKGKTVYTVDIAMTNVKDPTTGRVRPEYQYMELDDTVFSRMEKEAEDLSNLYRTFTDEERNLLATLDVTNFDRVFQRPQKNEEVAGETNEPAYVDESETVYTAPTKTAPAATTTTTTATVKPQATSVVTKTTTAETAPTQSTAAEGKPYVGPATAQSDKVKSFLAQRQQAK